ncbi:MAG: tannase/feruloyl esterase family alpha/beta hydrolase, partial [Kiritimatiellae bacterium]|nr:tannase/feruloyl esterase family alpha/beta hydrolase [Kiritimatiellia bacterium]
MMRILVIAATLSFLLQVAFADAIPDRLERVKALSDEVLTVGKVGFHAKEDAPSKDPLWMFRAMDESSEAAPTGGFVRVDFTLAPESGSFIRCRAELPLPEKWNGTFWGRGNSGYAGSIPRLRGFAANGDAAVTTDLGTGRITNGGRSAPERWTDATRKDFDWRATHLMTVYGKRIVKAFYGESPRRNYFNGGSTGGRQAMSEAIRFPSDYDGIIASLPDNNALAVEIASWHLYRQTHDVSGRLLFSTNEMRVVADAAVEFKRKTDPVPYAGNALADARFSEEEIDAYLHLAAKKCPSLKIGGKLARLKAIHSPLTLGGECVFNGFAPGSYLVPRMNKMGIVYLRAYLLSLGIDESKWGQVGEKEILGFIREYAPTFNACSGDLSAFRRRGGKLIMTAGWEDQTIPPGLIVDYYERVVEADGGLDCTLEYFRLFCVAGCAHGGGKGSIITGAPGGAQVRRKLADWVDKG